MLNQLLDVSRLETGKLTLERQPADLASLVEQAVADARARSNRHAFTCQARLPIHACVDALRLEQVFTNLLDNAMKYSPDGGPIDVELVVRDGRTAELSVRDRGLGIPPDKREHIFERFCQAHTTDYRSGIGLGLYVSREIVELHGGTIDVDFPPDGGTRFVVQLPV